MVTSASETERLRPLSSGVDAASPLGLGLLALLLIAGGAFFAEGFVALAEAWRLPEYSHGPLIPVLSGLLFLRHLKAMPPEPGPVADRWPGVVLIAASLGLGLMGKLAGIYDAVAYAMIAFVGGVVLVSFGWRRGRGFWPSVLHLVFMLPLPATLYWKVSTSLQMFSSELGVWFIQLAGVSVFLEGNIIDLGVYKLHVAEACSGLRYLYPILSFSYIFATLYRGPLWHKAVLLVSAAPITILMNSVRIGIIGVVVDRYGLEHVEGLTHLLEGWVIFLASVAILFGMARAMLALQPQRMGLSEALDLDLSGLAPQIGRLRLTRLSAALAAAAALAGGTAVAWHATPPRAAPEIAREPLALMPQTLGGWRSLGLGFLDPKIEVALKADDYFSASFAHGERAAGVDVFIAWYGDQTQGGIHSPEVCLPGGGWEMAQLERVEIAVPSRPDLRVPLNRAVIQKGQDKLLVYYWFEQYGGRTASDYVAKASLLRDGLLYGRTDGSLIRLITRILPDERPVDAEARLLDILGPLMDELPRFVPGRDAGHALDAAPAQRPGGRT